MDVYQELDIESVLQCPVCMELPANAIFLCKVGHHVCDKCRRKLTLCPTCQSTITSSRNFLAEALITKFSIFKDGDDTPGNLQPNGSVVSKTNGNHVVNSPLGEGSLQDNTSDLTPLHLPAGCYKCLLEACHNRGEMGVGDMFAHVQSVHSHLLDRFQNNKATFQHNFENFCLMKGRRKYHRVMHISNMGLFFLLLHVSEDKYINCWLSAPTPFKKANNFDYALEFSKEGGVTNLQFTNKVASNLQNMDWLLQRGKVFVIPPSKHSLTWGNFFSLHVKVVYKNAPL